MKSKKNLPNKLTEEEDKIVHAIIISHMQNMVEELNTVNKKNKFTGFEKVASNVLYGVAVAIQEGYKVEIKLDISEDNTGKVFFDGTPINLN